MANIRGTHNWSGHLTFSAARYHEPETIAELQEIVKDADQVSVIGSRHSFNGIADTTGDLIWLGKLPQNIQIDKENKKVTVSAGITYEDLCPELEKAGLALPNLASLKHITVIGACMTATHGSGDKNQNLSAAISGIELIDSKGNLRTITRESNPDLFPATIITLGALGVVTNITLDLVPSFKVQQNAYQGLSFSDVFQNFDDITSAAYSVSLFPTWQHEFIDTLWLKHKLVNSTHADTPPVFFSASRRPPEIAKETDEVRTLTPFETPTPWDEQLNHYYFHEPETEGNELQSEYFIPREFAVDAIQAVRNLKDGLKPILGLSEIRTMAADDLWLSPAYKKETVGIHFNWLKKGKEAEAFLPTLEKVLAPFEAKPHFEKLFAMDHKHLLRVYPKLEEFKELVKNFDPEGKFSNHFIKEFILGEK
jgi:xylitol oxidase